jgi:biopolymer transport protein ExbD
MLLRRSTAQEPRIELVPLIDVLMFMLTFFLVAMTVATRIELMPMNLQSLRAAETGTSRPAVTIALGLDGGLAVDREAVALEGLADALRARLDAKPDAVVYLAVADGQGEVDRAPILQEVLDRLKEMGVSVSLVGRPSESRPRPEAAPSS